GGPLDVGDRLRPDRMPDASDQSPLRGELQHHLRGRLLIAPRQGRGVMLTRPTPAESGLLTRSWKETRSSARSSVPGVMVPRGENEAPSGEVATSRRPPCSRTRHHCAFTALAPVIGSPAPPRSTRTIASWPSC